LTTIPQPGKISPLSNYFWSIALANTQSAKKRAKQAIVRRDRNVSQKSTLRTSIKKALKAIQGGNKAEAQVACKEVSKLVDGAAGKKLIHANKAARLKSRLNAKAKAIA
jgi:small subunit ribosomal protein S20